MSLPPDPEGMNNQRAEWAGEALRKFQRDTSCDEDDETVLGDLLCDLMHWCDREKVDFHVALRRGQDHYREETTECL